MLALSVPVLGEVPLVIIGVVVVIAIWFVRFAMRGPGKK